MIHVNSFLNSLMDQIKFNSLLLVNSLRLFKDQSLKFRQHNESVLYPMGEKVSHESRR